MPKPTLTLLYVDSAQTSAAFYERLLGTAPVEASATFAMFVFPSGLRLGLWSRQGVEPPAPAVNGGCELALTVAQAEDVDATCARWREMGLPILQAPTAMDFGRTFVAQDPDGHRLRVFCPGD